MNNIGKNIIELILKNISEDDHNALRQCSKYLSITVGRIYFHKIRIYGSRMYNSDFRYFCYKYKPSLYITNIWSIRTLAFIQTYNNLRSVEIAFNNDTYVHCIPNVYKLKLQCNVDEFKHSIIVPSSVKKLYIQGNCNKPIKVYQSVNTIEIKLEKKYKNCLVLPSTLTKLVMISLESCRSNGFNQPIDELPESLTELNFSSNYKYNQPIKDGVLPTSLTKLSFGIFDRSIGINTLPTNLKELCFGDNFNRSLNILPPTLEKLTFDNSFNQPLPRNLLPTTLKKLSLGYRYNQPLLEGVLPESLIKLDLGYMFDQSLNINDKNEYMNGSISDASESMNGSVLPSSLKKLKISSHYNHDLDDIILSSLEKLTFGEDYYETITDVTLPPNLKTLILSNQFDEKLKVGFLPSSLTKLNLGHAFDQELNEGVLPESLIELTLGMSYRHKIRKYVLPRNLQVLKTYCCLKHISLPKSIKRIKQYFEDEYEDNRSTTVKITVNG
jgi:hypothetical protein